MTLSPSTNLRSRVRVPFLPGTTFNNPKQENFAKDQTLGYVDGIPTEKFDYPGIGGTFQHSADNHFRDDQVEIPRDFSSTWTFKNREFATVSQPAGLTVTSKELREQTLAEETKKARGYPAHIAYDKVVLSFTGYWKEPVHESQVERERVRQCEIYYYMEDDTISINEHQQMNSGIVQGTFLARHRIPKEMDKLRKGFITLEDLVIGNDILVYGKVIHICDANPSTREFILDKFNYRLPPLEPIEVDDHHRRRDVIESHIRVGRRDPDSKFRQFLREDRHVLRFNALWNDSKVYGEPRYFALHYFLADNTIELLEMRKVNSGYEAFPSFVRRQRIPRDGSCPVTMTDQDFEEYKPNDFAIGNIVKILNRDYLIYDLDDYTKAWYNDKFGTTDFTPINVYSEKTKTTQRELPPHLGFGQELDELATCFHVQPRPWPKDYFKLLVKDKDQFHFLVRMESANNTESDRRFILTVFLNDESLALYEPQKRNSGIVTGKMMDRARHYKPDSNIFYGIRDFYVGGVVFLRGKNYVILDCDNKTLQVQRQMGLPPPDPVRVEAEFRLRISQHPDWANKIRPALLKFTAGGCPPTTVQQIWEVLWKHDITPSAIETQAFVDVWHDPSSLGGGEGEGGKGFSTEVDIGSFLRSFNEVGQILSGELFRPQQQRGQRTVSAVNLNKTAGGGVTDGLHYGGMLGGALQAPPTAVATNLREGAYSDSLITAQVKPVRDAMYATTTQSVPATTREELATTTQRGGTVARAPQPSPARNLNIPHSTGLSTGAIKQSLLDGETEDQFRARLRDERRIVTAVVERINLKHATFTEAYKAFTLNQNPRLSLSRFETQLIKFNLLQKKSDMDIVIRHFFGQEKEIGYQEFLRAMHPEESPLEFWAAIAPDQS